MPPNHTRVHPLGHITRIWARLLLRTLDADLRIGANMHVRTRIPDTISISFVAPVTPAEFNVAREDLSRNMKVVTLRDLGTSAWASPSGGLLFVLKGAVDIVISASATSLVELKAIARKITEAARAA